MICGWCLDCYWQSFVFQQKFQRLLIGMPLVEAQALLASPEWDWESTRTYGPSFVIDQNAVEGYDIFQNELKVEIHIWRCGQLWLGIHCIRGKIVLKCLGREMSPAEMQARVLIARARNLVGL
jgi:hypothetical protein